ncbi:MFS transporter [Natrinema sp. CBA1119]|uniref:MFS transporter n=1 Tax=Natrinema sp. CBA1119 TaxID=1608465 RepID=UPI00159BCD9E|nr:MFS transporter [Natrinema sp. CBA1119]
MDRHHWLLAALMGGIHSIFHVFMRLIPAFIPVLTGALGYPLWKLGMLVSAYFVGSSVGLLPMGELSDRYDRRITLSGALAIVGLGYLLFSVAPLVGTALPETAIAGLAFDGPFVVMATSMVISGFGTSAHVPVGVPLLTANATADDRGKLLGIWGGSSKIGDAVGPAAVGVLILVLGWQAILFSFGLLGLVCAAGLYVILGASGFETRPVGDQAERDDNAETWESLLADRRRYLYPMLVLVGYFAAYSIVVQGTITFVPAFITDVYGYSFSLGSISFGPESFADFALSVLLVGAAISRFVGGYLVDRYEHRLVLVATLIMAAAAMFVFSLASLGPVALIVVLIVFGAGLWGNSPARDSLVSDLGPDEREGRTFSYLWTASRVFGALSPTAIGFLAGSAGIRKGFTYLSIATLIAALFVALLFSNRIYRDNAIDPDVALDD